MGKKVSSSSSGSPVLDSHGLEVRQLLEPPGEVVGERLVGIDDRVLGDADRHQEEGVGAEVLQRLDVGADRRLLLRQQLQHVGVEAQPQGEGGRQGDERPGEQRRS